MAGEELQRRHRRGHRRRRRHGAAHPRGAQLPRRRAAPAGQCPFGRPPAAVQGGRAGSAGARPRLVRGHRPRLLRRRRRGEQGVRAAGRRCRRHGHRQVERVPHGPGRAAGGARGQRRAPGVAHGHHRHAQLLHHPDGRGAQAHLRRGRHQARRREHLPVRVGQRPGRHRRARRADPPVGRRRARDAAVLPAPDRLQRAAAHRQLPAVRLHQGRAEDGRRDHQDLRRPGPQGHRHLRARAGVRGAQRGAQRADLEEAHGRRGSRAARRLPRHRGRRRPGGAAVPAAARRRGQGPGVRGAHPRGRHRGERSRSVGRRRQPA